MVCFVNMKQESIIFYTDSGSRKFNIKDISNIRALMGNEQIYYVTAAKMVSSIDIIGMLQNKSPIKGQSQSANKLPIGNDVQYLRSKFPYELIVPKPNPKNNEDAKVPLLEFKNQYHCILYDDRVKKIVYESDILKLLIKKGDVELIGYEQSIQYNAIYQQQLKLSKKREDALLDDMIIDSRVKDFSVDREKDDDMSDIDLGSDIDRGFKTELEELSSLGRQDQE